MRLLLCLCAALLFCAPANAGTPVSGGYQEAVFIVSDAEAYRSILVEEAAWSVVHVGVPDPVLLEGWGLARNTKAREIVLANPGTERGFIRLIEFVDVAQRQIRPHAQTWETGGWFDVNVRVSDMDAIYARLTDAGFVGYSEPVKFSFGPFVVSEWLTRGPDGIVFALIERISPPLEGWPNLRKMSRLFNATQIVDDIEAARRFYVDKLGFEIYLEHSGASDEPGPNVLGLPHNLADDIVRRVFIVHPQGTNEGSIELLSFAGAGGRDFSSHAAPPDLGIVTLRFPVRDIDAFSTHVVDQGIETAMQPIRVTLPPYGELELMAVRGPGGVWLEFYQQADRPAAAVRSTPAGEEE